MLFSIFSSGIFYRILFLPDFRQWYSLFHVIPQSDSFSERSALRISGISTMVSILPRQYRTVRYIDYIIRASLRHKVTWFVAHEAAQIEFILCEFPESHLVKATPTTSRVSVSAANVVPEQPDCQTQIQTHTYTHSVLSFLRKVCLPVTEFGVDIEPSLSRTTSLILAVPGRSLNESDNDGEEHLSALLPDGNTDARPCLLCRLVNGESSSSFYWVSFVPAGDGFRALQHANWKHLPSYHWNMSALSF